MKTGPAIGISETPCSTDVLTVREREVLAQVALGLPCKAIAARLDISESTVRKHRASLRRKLKADNGIELTRSALAQPPWPTAQSPPGWICSVAA